MVLHFLESSEQTKERNFDDFQLQRTGKRSFKAKVQQLPTMKIIPPSTIISKSDWFKPISRALYFKRNTVSFQGKIQSDDVIMGHCIARSLYNVNKKKTKILKMLNVK